MCEGTTQIYLIYSWFIINIIVSTKYEGAGVATCGGVADTKLCGGEWDHTHLYVEDYDPDSYWQNQDLL